MSTCKQGSVTIMSTLSRGTVSISPSIERAFRQRMGKDYGGIFPGISQAPLGLLMRFAVLIQAGIPVEEAIRGLSPLPRGVNRHDHIRV